MERIVSRQPIAEALDLIPAGLRRRVEHADFLTGVDPTFVGFYQVAEIKLRNAVPPNGVQTYSYGDVASVCWTFHQEHILRADRRPTVVLPWSREHDILILVHELGHVLDEQIGFSRPDAAPVNWYAYESPWEAFAEAFVCYVAPDLAAADEWSAYDLDAARADRQMVEFFDLLSV